MKRLLAGVAVAVVAGCAGTAPPPPAAPPPLPSATPTPAVTPVVPAPAPTPEPAPSPAPHGPVPGVAPAAGSAPIRVLLRRTTGPTSLPQPGRAYHVRADGETVWLWGPLEIVPASDAVWQVGAWSSAAAGATAAGRLGRTLGAEAVVSQESTGTGLVRVRVRWPDGEPPDVVSRLAAAGYRDAFRIAGGGTALVSGVGGSLASTGEIELLPSGEWPTVVGGRSYRGWFRIRIVGRELLLINELPLEDYLRGVVPVEMGPYQFPELEALKAQAVAARTYAVAHLGDHDAEGWDICDTPACQAYHGAGAEHPLSDRAVSETAGLIARYAGRPIDAMYTSTCGGHTEDAAELFADRAQPYLVGVACAWDRPLELVGDGIAPSMADDPAFRRWLARQALELGTGEVSPTDLLVSVAALCGGRVRQVPPTAPVGDWVAALLAAGGLGETGPVAPGEGVERLLRLADLFEIRLRHPPADPWASGWHLEAATAVLELEQLMVTDRGEAVPHPDGVAIYPRRADASEILPVPVRLFSRFGDRRTSLATLEVLPGTTLERTMIGDRILALVAVESGGGGEADRRSAWRSWRRERSWSELSEGLGVSDLTGLEVVRRGRSGRVVELAAVDRRGGRRVVTGFEVRRVLDLPETLFEMREQTLPDGTRVVRFLGRGWGHGVGLCQNGAYGLARAGMTFDAILRHYYSGVEIGSQ